MLEVLRSNSDYYMKLQKEDAAQFNEEAHLIFFAISAIELDEYARKPYDTMNLKKC